MPWFNLRDMSDDDLRAMYRFIRELGPKGERAPAAAAPGVARQYAGHRVRAADGDDRQSTQEVISPLSAIAPRRRSVTVNVAPPSGLLRASMVPP